MKPVSLVLITGVFWLTSFSVFAQSNNQGIGLRIGDPLGVSYKMYMQGNTALEFVFGTVSRNSHNAYYKDTFRKKDKFDDFIYSDHDVDYTIVLMGRYLFHEAFPANVEGRLDWYYGGGVQLRVSNVNYQYFDELDNIDSEEITNIDLGPEAILGVEYELKDYPIVGFGEVSLLMELVDRPFHFRAFGAIGVRYAFNR
jgi:hypothetical protein